MSLDDEAVPWPAHEALERGENPERRRPGPPRRFCTVEGCGRPRVSNGLCSMHHQRVKAGLPVGPAHSLRDADYRFNASYEVDENGCWIWQRFKDPHGYGRFSDRGSDGMDDIMAYRWAYQRHVGPIPDGLTLDHLCKTPACVNPSHLEPVTRSENSRRAATERRSAAFCFRGHEFNDENTYWYGGRRHCKECVRERGRQYRARMREAKAS